MGTKRYVQPATNGRSRLIKGVEALRGRVGRFLRAIHAPGLIRDASINDELTGIHLLIRTGISYTVISVDGRDFYFNRLSGAYDGTGSTAECLNPHSLL